MNTETIQKPETTKTPRTVGRWFRLCPVRHILTLCGAGLIGVYFLLRGNPAVMAAVSGGFVRPFHRAAARLTGPLPFSLAEALIVAGVLAALGYLAVFIVGLIRRRERAKRVYRLLLTALCAFTLLYGGFCLFWGVYYYTSDFEARSGIQTAPVRTQQLETVTRYFTDLLNHYARSVRRDENGVFAEPRAEYFSRSAALYENAARLVPCLAGDAVPAKPFFFSYFMSCVDFTGFYFPFTGEANINVHAPGCLIPSTIAHEQAHQRGVAQEDEANFCAVLASLESGDPVYCYSACLLAYIHLGNALYTADHDAWADNYARLAPEVRADLAENNAYWARFRTPVANVSNSVYTGFLQSYGQTLGLQTYGKCVDLLVTYYYDRSAAALSGAFQAGNP